MEEVGQSAPKGSVRLQQGVVSENQLIQLFGKEPENHLTSMQASSLAQHFTVLTLMLYYRRYGRIWSFFQKFALTDDRSSRFWPQVHFPVMTLFLFSIFRRSIWEGCWKCRFVLYLGAYIFINNSNCNSLVIPMSIVHVLHALKIVHVSHSLTIVHVLHSLTSLLSISSWLSDSAFTPLKYSSIYKVLTYSHLSNEMHGIKL